MTAEADGLTVGGVGMGTGYMCAVLSDGSLACWGDDWSGRASPPSGTFTAVDGGAYHACAIRSDGTIACWGDTSDGRASPPPGTYSSLSAGGGFTCAVGTDGALACWGANPWGQTTPPSGSFVAVGAGTSHACAIRTDGTLVCWGFNSYGDTEPPAGTFTKVEAGSEHSCAIRTDGTIACWGRNFEGQATPPAGTFLDLSIGQAGADSCAIRSDGTLSCWGNNYFGHASVPPGTYTSLSAAQVNACAVRTDGALGCWGGNWYGELDAVLVQPASVEFGSVLKGKQSDATAVVVTNLGIGEATVSGVTIAGRNATDYAVTSDSCTGAPVPPVVSCAVAVAFRPLGMGSREASLTINGPAPVGTWLIPLSGTGFMNPSNVAWGTTYRAGPAYTWNGGNALGRTVQSGSQRLHLAYATSRIGSRWAKDTGPYMGVYYVRSTSGSTWSTPKRLNSSTQHAERPGLAAAGSRVYVTWVSQTKIVRYSPTAPRVLYVRVNTSHGASTSWRSPVRLTSTSGRVDYPTIAASGYDVHVAWTDAVTGSVKVATSRDRGATWKKVSLGTTSLYDKSGKVGLPAVAVSGSTVAVTWLADRYGTIKARISTNRGVSWGSAVTVGSQSAGSVSVAVRGSRIAVAWATASDVVVRQRVGGTWGEPVGAGGLASTPEGPFLYGPAVALQDPQRVAVAWAEGHEADPDRSNLRWAESSDGGASWFATQTIAAAATSRWRNDYPSILWPTASTRYVAWNGWTPWSTSYRLYLRKGSGAPVGPTYVAPEWVAAADAETVLPGAGKRVAPLVAPDGWRAESPPTE